MKTALGITPSKSEKGEKCDAEQTCERCSGWRLESRILGVLSFSGCRYQAWRVHYTLCIIRVVTVIGVFSYS